MKVHPKNIGVLYVKRLMCVKLHPNQVWEMRKNDDGEYEVTRDCVGLLMSETDFLKYFTPQVSFSRR